MQRTAQGFSLLELLVVMAIIGIVAGTVSVAVRADPKQDQRREAERLARLFELAHDQARLLSRAVVWQATTAGYRFEMRDEDEWKSIDDEALRARAWQLAVTEVEPARIVLGVEPLLTPQDIRIRLADGMLALHLDAHGRLSVRDTP